MLIHRYPHLRPMVKFHSRIFHPYVHTDNGWVRFKRSVLLVQELEILVSYPSSMCASRRVMWSVLVSICMYVCMWPPKKFEWHFSGRLTFSNTRGRFLVEFIDYLYHCVLQKSFPRWVNHWFPYLMCTLLLFFCPKNYSFTYQSVSIVIFSNYTSGARLACCRYGRPDNKP